MLPWDFYLVCPSQRRWHILSLVPEICSRKKKEVGKGKRGALSLLREKLYGEYGEVFIQFSFFSSPFLCKWCRLRGEGGGRGGLLLLQLPCWLCSPREQTRGELPAGFPSYMYCINMYTLHMVTFLSENISSWVSDCNLAHIKCHFVLCPFLPFVCPSVLTLNI